MAFLEISSSWELWTFLWGLFFCSPLIWCVIILISILVGIDQSKTFLIALWLSAFSFFFSICLFFFFIFIPKNTNFPFAYGIELFFFPFKKISFLIGVDALSFFFVLLTNLFIYLCIFHLYHTINKRADILIYLFILQFGLVGAFSVFDILGFFIFFETTLIPIFFMILIFGSRERKVRASYMIAVYTLFGSIFLLFNILYLYSKIGTTDYYQLLICEFNETDQKFLWITFFIAFAAKIPMLPLHMWLPEAHVEAPTIGSVLLAALLLKLGTYGIVRFLISLFPEATVYFSPLINVFAILSILYTSLTALRQIDLKKIIAYSSVGHMNAVLLGLLVFSVENIEGAIFQMISHAIVSGALFFCVGSFYLRYKVRSLDYFGGLMTTYPLLSIIFMIFSMANISFPGTSNFIGEFMICFGLFNHNPSIVMLASINMVVGAAYTLWAYNRIAFGNIKNLYLKYHFDIKRDEFYLYSLLIFLMLFIGIYPSSILNPLHEIVTFIIYGNI